MKFVDHVAYRARPYIVVLTAGTAVAGLVGEVVAPMLMQGATWGALIAVQVPLLSLLCYRPDTVDALPVGDILADAEEIAPIAWCTFDVTTRAMQWSAALYRILARDPAQTRPSVRTLLHHLAPSDRTTLLRLARDIVQAPPDEAEPVELCLRVRQHADAARVVRLRLRLQRDIHGQPTMLVAVLTDLTAALSHVESLSTATEEAMATTRIKRVLLDNVSHEIRTPLTSILGFAEILSEESTEEHRALLNHITQAGQRLLTTMSAMLSLAYLEGGMTHVLEGHTDVAALLREELRRYDEAAHERGLALHATLPERPLTVPVAPAYLKQLLEHLLGNALKFTSEGRVTVVLSETDGMARLDVEDTGIGISESFLPHLFEPFLQESDGRTRQFEGTGLGLAVVKHIIDAVGGGIRVASRKGGGSTFTVMLPLFEHYARPETCPAADTDEPIFRPPTAQLPVNRFFN